MSNSNYLTIPPLSKDVIQRFFSKVKIDTKTGCWNWKAGKTGSGYGASYLHRKQISSHRFTYAWLRCPLPKGKGKNIKQLDHVVCDNKSCCNPWHVKLVSHKENTLRATGSPAINARKTHCIRGHLLPENKNHSGYRRCKICNNEYQRKCYRLKKLSQLIL